MSIEKIAYTSHEIIAPFIKSTRYYNQKTKAVKLAADLIISRWDGKLENAQCEDKWELRNIFLSVKGIGNETADSIVLYVFDKLIFVIDAYTKRIFSRLDILRESDSYKTYQDFFMQNLKEDVELYKDFHAQIVYLGHLFCRPKPLCENCPLSKEKICSFKK